MRDSAAGRSGTAARPRESPCTGWSRCRSSRPGARRTRRRASGRWRRARRRAARPCRGRPRRRDGGAAICWSLALSCSLGSFAHALAQDRRPVIELRGVGVGQRVLVFGAAQPAAEGQVLADLEEGVDVLDLRQLRAATRWMNWSAETLRSERGFSCTNMRTRFSAATIDPCRRRRRRSRPPDPAAGCWSPGLPVDHGGEEMSWRPSTVMKMKPVSCWGNRPLGTSRKASR